MTTSLTFQNTKLSVIDQNNQIWLTVTEIGKALGYADPFKSVKNIYDRHRDEFTEKMTALIDMPTAGGLQKVRIFSLRGAHLIGMFSHTKTAKDFRKWVLDVLDDIVQPQQLALPEPETQYPFEFTENELQTLAWAFFILLRNADTFRAILPALEKLGSTITPSIYGQAFDYHSVIKDMHRIVEKLTANFEFDPNSNWRVLEHVRNFNPKAKAYIAN